MPSPRIRAAVAATVALAVGVLALAPTPASAAPPTPRPDRSAIPLPRFEPGNLVGIVNQAPASNGYFTCVGGYVYADFDDPDDDTATLTVQLNVYGAFGARTATMAVSTGYHGTFWYLPLAAMGVDPAQVGLYAVQATDPHGATSGWSLFDAGCNAL